MKFLVVGLGNIGAKYKSTRHNIGFKALDFIAKEFSAFFIEERYGEISSFKYKGKNIYLLKPNTFMNLSGLAVGYWMTKLKIDVKNLLIITDDLNLEVGNLRMKRNGSDGGHNGLKDIQETFSSSQYPRLRIGVGNNFSRGKQIDYVLGEWTEQECLILDQKMKIINEMVLSFCFAGIENTMNSFNNK
tara:strand:+ start:1666 stop:2229 length:564 start_codon:yes stop_codon:yes gene_type:complete